MAFFDEEYSNVCRDWITNNRDFYSSKIDKAKTLEIGGLLHMYQLALENIPVNPLSPIAGEYGDVVKKYHKLIHSTFGVKALISGANSLSSFFMSDEDVVLFSASWLIHGDFYENIVYQIIDSYNNSGFRKKELSLFELKNRILYESILLGVRTLEDWQRYDREMKEIKGWTILPDDFVAPTPFGQNGNKYQEELPTDKSADKPEKNKEGENEAEVNTFFCLLKCDDGIKAEVVKALANEIVRTNSSDRIANIRLALERKKWIDSEVPYLQFHNAFDSAIKPLTENGFRLISRGRGSNVYSANKYLLLREEKKQLSEDEEARLYEIKRICKLLNNIGTNAVNSTESEDS